MCDIPVDPLTSSSGSWANGSGSNSDFTIVGHKKHTQRVGTHLYMSPEQAKGLPYNYKVDIYSLGLILFELLVYFGTEFERCKVLEGVRNHNFPQDFQKSFTDEVKLSKKYTICAVILMYFFIFIVSTFTINDGHETRGETNDVRNQSPSTAEKR